MAEDFRPGDRVEYIAAPVFDLIIETGDIGVVTEVGNGWVHAVWPRSGEHSVPLQHVRRARAQGGPAGPARAASSPRRRTPRSSDHP